MFKSKQDITLQTWHLDHDWEAINAILKHIQSTLPCDHELEANMQRKYSEVCSHCGEPVTSIYKKP